jgi:type VI secretion system protein ImpB
MAKGNMQADIEKVRRPRVHISYNVETNGAIEKRELPFVAGVLADLSGNPATELPPVMERKFTEIDRDSFDTVLSKMAPRLVFKVDNKLNNDDTRMSVELKFKKLDDFEPQNVVEMVEPLRQLIETRRKLANLRSSLGGNNKLEKMLQKILHDSTQLNKLRGEIGRPEADPGKGN